MYNIKKSVRERQGRDVAIFPKLLIFRRKYFFFSLIKNKKMRRLIFRIMRVSFGKN